ncbi:hypothetical protein KKD19_06215 [Patescibacteria group bacterium]|nr:hypothetical protein [Patescibacteria group bacterium]MBU4512799.1 hypothetical protein [Patescibacteria group bacterium]
MKFPFFKKKRFDISMTLVLVNVVVAVISIFVTAAATIALLLQQLG